MYKYILLLLTSIISFGCTQKKGRESEGIKLTGNLEQFPNGGFAYLEYIGKTGIKPFDTLDVDEDGNFVTYVTIDEPAFYQLNFNGRQIIHIILTGKETEVKVKAHGSDPKGFYEISGSSDTDYKRKIDELIQNYQTKMQELQQNQQQARVNNNIEAFMETQKTMTDVSHTTEIQLKKRIREASPSLAAYFGIQMIDPSKNNSFIDSIATELKEEMPDNFYVADLLSKLAKEKSTAIGMEAPEIALANPQGEIITLSSLKGKYVLIDFWASWCKPCRIENPNVVRIYNEYAAKNFEILGVSLDRTKNQWLQAIEQDKLPWIHVSDLKFWSSQAARDYQVQAIPITFLIDPTGKIIAKNLRGASLEAKLKEILGS